MIQDKVLTETRISTKDIPDQYLLRRDGLMLISIGKRLLIADDEPDVLETLEAKGKEVNSWGRWLVPPLCGFAQDTVSGPEGDRREIYLVIWNDLLNFLSFRMVSISIQIEQRLLDSFSNPNTSRIALCPF